MKIHSQQAILLPYTWSLLPAMKVSAELRDTPIVTMSKKSKRIWPILLFSLPFSGVGIGFLVFSILPSLYDGLQMRTWHEAQANVISSELNSYSGDSTTYEAIGLYDYLVAGEQYAGSRLGISGGADNVGEWHQRISGKLRSARESQNTITIFYNPKDPGEAVVDRSLRWNLLGFKMIFVLVFGGAGVGLLYWAVLDRNKIIDTPEAASKPWLGHRDWSSSTIRSDAKATFYVAWIVALFWNVISSPVLFAIPEELRKGNNAILLAGLFPVVGLALIGWAFNVTRRWRALGATPLTLDPYPGSIGGQVAGSIATNIRYSPSHQFPVTLSCIYSYKSGSGKDRKRQENVKWSAEGYAQIEPSSRGSRLLFCFDVPPGLEQSEIKGERYHLWRLNIKSDGTPVNLNRNFELPVFSTAEASQVIRADSVGHPLAQEKRDTQIDSVMSMRQTSDGLELYFPAGRNIGFNGGITAFGLLFLVAGMGAGYLGAPMILTVIFGLVGGAIALGGLYSLLNSLRVHIDRRGVRSTRSLLGMIISKASAPASEIEKLRIHKTGSMTSGAEHKVFHAIRAHLRNGKKITLAESLIGQSAAEEVADSLAVYGGLQLNKTVVTISQVRAERRARKMGGN
ncbi:MAG: DUF3592 domain-containing protein [Halioglobus sp.]